MRVRTLLSLMAVAVVLTVAGWTVVRAQVAPAPSPVALPQITRVAVCDVAQVFESYRRAADLTAQFKKRTEDLGAEDEKRRATLRALQAELDVLKPDSPEYEKKLTELRRQTLEQRVWLELEQGIILREHRMYTEKMYNEVIEAVGALAREQGIQLVLYRDQIDLRSETTPELQLKMTQRKVLYNHPDLDITAEVLGRLNQQYQSTSAPQ